MIVKRKSRKDTPVQSNNKNMGLETMSIIATL